MPYRSWASGRLGVGSTSGIITDHAGASDAVKSSSSAPKAARLYELETRNFDKVFLSGYEDACSASLAKKVTLEKVRDCLRDETNEVFVDDHVAGKAVRALERMLELAK